MKAFGWYEYPLAVVERPPGAAKLIEDLINNEIDTKRIQMVIGIERIDKNERCLGIVNATGNDSEYIITTNAHFPRLDIETLIYESHSTIWSDPMIKYADV